MSGTYAEMKLDAVKLARKYRISPASVVEALDAAMASTNPYIDWRYTFPFTRAVVAARVVRLQRSRRAVQIGGVSAYHAAFHAAISTRAPDSVLRAQEARRLAALAGEYAGSMLSLRRCLQAQGRDL